MESLRSIRSRLWARICDDGRELNIMFSCCSRGVVSRAQMASIETEVQLRGVNGGAEGLVAVEEGTWGGRCSILNDAMIGRWSERLR